MTAHAAIRPERHSAASRTHGNELSCDEAEDGSRQVADIVNISSIAGREAWNGYGVYNMTKFGVNGFTEALRQEVTKRHVRVGVLEPGGVTTELGSHNTGAVLEEIDNFYATTEALAPEDIADRGRLHGHPASPRLHRGALDHAHRPGLTKTSRTVFSSGSTQRAGTPEPVQVGAVTT